MILSSATEAPRNPSKLARVMIGRYRMLMASVDLSAISLMDFQTLVALKDALDTSTICDARHDFR
jgi:hypothetical protein